MSGSVAHSARGAVLVTGASGFVGSHLVPALEADGGRVVSLRKPGTPECDWGREWIDADLRAAGEVSAALDAVRPDRLIHLAAVAFPPDAASDPLETLRLNYLAVHHLANALARHAPRCRFLYVGTAQVYRAHPAEAPPLAEQTPLLPESVYAASKAAAEARLALGQSHLDVIVARPFNHSGPGRPPLYAESSFARQIARIERGEQPPVLRVGNLDAIRDFSDVRDVVGAYRLLLERARAGSVFNVCSGRGHRIREIVDFFVGRCARAVRVEVDPALHRPLPPERCALVGDPGRLRDLGWEPRYSFEDTLEALLADWRARA